STQVELLRFWLEEQGHAVSNTGLNRSPLTQPGLDAAKQGHTLGRITFSLFYATDFADRLENQIIPALKAGFYVLADRYFYSICARDIVRGADPTWVRGVYGFALVPDVVFYLKVDLDNLVHRVVNGRGFNYWEAGLDLGLADNLYDSFCLYQTRLMEQFDRMVLEYGFVTVDANRDPLAILEDLKGHITRIIRREDDAVGQRGHL
ncbi:MAG TPA: hypothetical protein VNJ09_07270, partial [Chthonomonadales bacterium]|nr:hypothetical protein [Chthonomonadales bacterium]